MFCWKCGKEQTSGAVYCYNCGTKLLFDPGAPGMAPGAAAYAGFWKRFFAWIIDVAVVNATIFMAGVVLVYILDYAEVEETNIDTAIEIMWYIAGFFGSWLYYSIFESSYRQATPGKIALGIIVTDGYGKRISFGRATGRHFAKIISWFILGIGLIMISFTGRKQGLHDMIAGTIVTPKEKDKSPVAGMAF